MENNAQKAAAEDVQAAKTTTAEKFESFKADAGKHLNDAAVQLDELKEKLVAQAQEFGKDIDVDGIKAKATEHFEAVKVSTSENLATLQAQAETIFAAASAKADELSNVAEDKFDDMKAEASVHLEAAQVKLDELKAEAALQIEEAKEKAKGIWSQLFGK
ncbi:hypothetical protein [Spirosoma agri]|uniref:YtxH domain-containing protein n=1 Tax=Spirosoma agri TaxID=1987381 RepID=A0A6M0IP03_9BACT|nr:hypothetical protein [Spirosoma agri]NEU69295.1 hypothetical protein [Spirosoma agri]